jgi:uncharacterized membrane protein
MALIGICNSLYQLGGQYVVLLPVSYILRAVADTTGIIALLVAIWSRINDGKISAHWYLFCYCTRRRFLRF